MIDYFCRLFFFLGRLVYLFGLVGALVDCLILFDGLFGRGAEWLIG